MRYFKRKNETHIYRLAKRLGRTQSKGFSLSAAADVAICTSNDVWCEGEHRFLEQSVVDKIDWADELYFVASRTSMCSTALQFVVLESLPLSQAKSRWLLRLEETEIPLGFAEMKSLPEQTPQ